MVAAAESVTRPNDAPLRERVAEVELLRWRGSGGGAPLVLLHGIGSHAQSWSDCVARLSGERDVFAWDAPGYGASRALADENPRADDYADALERVLRALRISRIVLVGHSLGCLFAARFAVTRPAEVAGLALLSPALGYGAAPGASPPPRVQARIDDLERLGPVDFAAARSANLVFEPERHPAVVARVREGMAAVRLPGYAQAVRALASGDLMRDAALIGAPTLVGVGAQDVVTPPAGAHRLAAALRRPVGPYEAAGVGHALPQQAPAQTAAWLGALCEVGDG